MAGVTFEGSARSTPTAPGPSPAWTSRSPTASSWCSSARPAAGRRPRCGWSPGWRTISEGVLRIGERVVNHVPVARPRHRDGLPELRALPAPDRLREHRVRAARSRRCRRTRSTGACSEAARILGLEAFLKRKPRALSGGQRQRVAMGRAIVRAAAGVPDGRAALEPRREAARPDARGDRRLQNDLGVTTIYVTHDQVEAMTMGDRVAVMRKGELQQVARRRSSTTGRSTSSSAASSAAPR